ncbi:acetyltransferase [Fervidicella metallireducens AeB]|uniref:Acetyltransferase n=2 Tax=Fervidicella TaxID=1403538 RepID=A0A017RU11_9CLOT|nr:acetyltransferase [Fervidicella metallireducens AeB]
MDNIYINTKRLVMRQFQDDDINQYISIMTNPNVTQYLGNRKNKTSAEVLGIMEKFKKLWSENGYGVWAVIEKSSGKIIGHCGYMTVEEYGEVELLYAFDENYWGKGFATEAAKAAIEYASLHYNWTKIIAMAYSGNAASNHILKKLGFWYDKEITLHGGRLKLYSFNLPNGY